MKDDSVGVGSEEKLYHLHIPKAGGTLFNSWLDTTVPASRARPPGYFPPGAQEEKSSLFRKFEDRRNELNLMIEAWRHNIWLDMFSRFDVLHDHQVIVDLIPKQTRCVTVLREPVARCLSLLNDYARLTPEDYTHKVPEHVALHEDIRNLAFLEALKRNRWNRFLDVFFYNHQVRIFAQGFERKGLADMRARQGRATLKAPLDKALAFLDWLDFVGLTERMDETLATLAARLGVCPPLAMQRRNETEKRPLVDEAELRALLSEFNQDDARLYGTVAATFVPEPYDTAVYEARHAAAQTARMTPRVEPGGWRLFDFNERIAGNGLHGRDAASTPDCAAWTGPGTETNLFFPVLEGEALHIGLDVRGHVAESVRAGLRLRVDGAPREFTSTPAPIEGERLVLAHRPERPFVRLTIETPHTLTDTEAGGSSDDRRAKGLLLRGYGWRPCT